MGWAKVGSDNSATRAAILEAAQAIMAEDGYPAVTSRAVAERAGLKSQLVHYYFRTMDDLYIAIYRRVVDQLAERQASILQSDKPLRALWELTGDPQSVALTYELVALANHRKALRAEMAEVGSRLRKGGIEIVSKALEQRGFPAQPWLPVLAALMLESLARSISLQSAIGITVGHEEALKAIDGLIDFIDR